MIRNPIDIAVSPELAKLIASRINDPEIEEPVTLGMLRHFVESLVPEEFEETENLHHVDDGDSLLDELETLISEYGEEANAADFLENEASEALSRIIEAVMDEMDSPPTLEDVRESIASGLAAKLIAEGALEEDEDETVLQEIEDMIDRFGNDAMAEDFLRYE